MNNLLLINAQKWLTELGIRTEVGHDFLRVNCDDVTTFGMNHDSLISELKLALNTNKIYCDETFEGWYHIASF
jgi:hypothetical protein